MKYLAIPTAFVVGLLLAGGSAGSAMGAATPVRKAPVTVKPAQASAPTTPAKKPAATRAAAKPVAKPAAKPTAKPAPKPVLTATKPKPSAPVRRAPAPVVRNTPRKAPAVRSRAATAAAAPVRKAPPQPKVPVIARNTSEFIDISYPEPGVRKSAVATRR